MRLQSRHFFSVDNNAYRRSDGMHLEPVPLPDGSRCKPDRRSELIDGSGEMKRALERLLFGIESSIIDLDFIPVLNGRLGTVGQRRAAQKYSGVIVQRAQAPLDGQHQVIEKLLGIPKQARPAKTLDHPFGDLSEAARTGHSPTRETTCRKQVRRLGHFERDRQFVWD
ncbi:hypothetical protein RX328_43030 [Bradyrhizobium sp. sBnM-33]|nr:hypothetical protein [Bradyrhizobium sp. sBnM-33]WOH50706.1 hypothetical protein RX328_43030 [Bradyrhizobium sp. sBnM-33]